MVVCRPAGGRVNKRHPQKVFDLTVADFEATLLVSGEAQRQEGEGDGDAVSLVEL